jgi:hypothetical protein
MGNYRNFKVAVYCTAMWVDAICERSLDEQLAFFAKHVKPDKVYVESYRSDVFVSAEQLRLVKGWFERRGVDAAGGVTTTGFLHEPKQRLYNTLCYTDPAMRARLKEAVERTAAVFDEIILDDFYFTACTCEGCRGERGGRSWAEFRSDLMARVSKELVLEPAKAVNPNCKVTIKYPNWVESYRESGYDPGVQKDLFDRVYTGTETRNTAQTHQHLPRYLSYSLMRWFENLAPGRNGGGWFDPFQCYPMDAYLEQAYLTVFAKPREITLFCWPALYDTALVPPLGFQLEKLDALMDAAGNCAGLPVYHPCGSLGEDHLEDYLGMAGIPLEAVPDFPAEAPALLLTASAACDGDIVRKLEAYVAGGGKAIVTSGFAAETLGRGLEGMTSIRLRGRRAAFSRWMLQNRRETERAYVQAAAPVTMPAPEYRNNATWPLIKGMAGDENFGVLLGDAYGGGELLTLAVPDNFSEIGHFPPEALAYLRREAMPSLYFEGPADIGLFAYGNGVFALYPFVTADAAPAKVQMHVKGDAGVLADIATGKEIAPLYNFGGETVFSLHTYPGKFVFYRIGR